MKILVLGASGMVGHTVSLYLHEQGHELTTFSRTGFPFCKNIIGDAMNVESLINLIRKNEFDLVINCIGILNSDCDREASKAIYLNSYLPHLIKEILKSLPTKLIQISTDCVFSGKCGPYHENSFRDGETFYDRTKALGEIEDDKNLTFRNSIIGPDNKKDGIGLFNWFMKQQGTIKGYNQVLWSGVTTLTLAKAIEKAAIENLTGIYNLVNNESISKFELLKLFNKYFRNDEVMILPCNDISLNKSLINNRRDFSFEVPSYEQMLKEMKEWIYNHKELYEHY